MNVQAGFPKNTKVRRQGMDMLWKTALQLTLVWGIGEMAAVAQTKTAPVAGPVKDVLPRAAPSSEIEELRKKLNGVIVFRDPVTGEFRSAGPGEQAALI